MQERIKQQIKDSLELKKKLLASPDLVSDIEKAAIAIIDSLQGGHKIMLAGNGGSAADAQHLAAEFVNKFNFDRPGLPAVALTTDTSIITSVGNDSSFHQVFARQLQALGCTGDIFIAISTSGNSTNLIESLKVAKQKLIVTIGMTGTSGGLMKDMCEILIRIPSDITPRIQEAQILVGHILCSIVEEELFRQK